MSVSDKVAEVHAMIESTIGNIDTAIGEIESAISQLKGGA